MTEPAEEETEPVGEEYYRTVEVGERTFQEFSLERHIYHVPVDEVCQPISIPTPSDPFFRTRRTG
jgi:hypothetical protein